MRIKNFQARIKHPKIPIWFGIRKKTYSKSRVIEISFLVLIIEISIIKYKNDKESVRDMRELIESNILCKDDGFQSRLKELEKKHKD